MWRSREGALPQQRHAPAVQRAQPAPQDPDIVRFLLETLSIGVVLVDRQLRVHTANGVAMQLLKSGRGLRVGETGRLMASVQRAQRDFREFIGRLLSLPASSKARMELPRHDGSILLVQGLAYVRPGTLESAGATHAILCLREYAERRPRELNPNLLKARYGLTAAETGLAVALLAGRSLAEHASQRDITLNTVRTQVQSLMRKVEVHRQADLIRVLAQA